MFLYYYSSVEIIFYHLNKFAQELKTSLHIFFLGTFKCILLMSDSTDL